MKKLFAALSAALLLGAVAPLVHAATGSSAPSAAPVRRASTDLATSLASESTAPLRVLVQATSRDAGVAAVQHAGLQMVTVLESVGVSVATGTPEQVRSLMKDGRVTYVEKDRPIRLYADDTADIATRTAEARSPGSPVQKVTTTTDRHGDGHGNGGVGQGRGNGNAAGTVVTSTPFTGAGRSIAIVDGGVDGTHPMFMKDGVSKVVRNFKILCHSLVCEPGEASDPFMLDVTDSGNDSDTMSLGGHGTHVASIAAGYETPYGDRRISGTAPGAHLVVLSVGESDSIFAADIALDWIALHHADPCEGLDHSCDPITVVNNSYGPVGGGEFDPSSATAAITAKLITDKVVMVWANGNGDATNVGGDGSDNRSNPEGQNPLPGVISVANYDDANTGTREGSLDSSSSRGDATLPATWPDVSAPGTNITAACRPYLTICNTVVPPESDPNFGTISGTSMASPHVAGIVALLQEAGDHLVQAHARDLPLTPADIENVLEDTAHKFQFGAPYWLLPDTLTDNPDASDSFDKGHGLVDTTAALASVLGVTDSPPTVASPCGPALVSDPPNDATAFVVLARGGPNEPQLDLLSTSATWDASAGALTFTITVSDLQADNPPDTSALGYEVDFHYADVDHYLLAERSSTGTSAEFGDISGTSLDRQAPATTVFDVDANTITITVTNADLSAAGVRPFATGDELSAIDVQGRRVVGAPDNPVASPGLLTTADSAAAACSLVLGQDASAAPTPDPQPFPTGDGGGTSGAGTLHDGETFTADATTTEDTTGVPGVGGLDCAGPSNPKCFNYTLQLEPGTAEGSSLIVTLSPTSDEQIATEDWDIYIYNAAGEQVNEPLVEIPGVASVDPGASVQTVGETFFGSFATIPAAGTYTVVVVPYEVPAGATVTVHADLTANSASPV